MSAPKISKAQSRDPFLLLVQFDNGQWRRYDLAPLLSKSAFAPLRDPALFHLVHVDAGGYGVIWNDEIDLSEHEIWLRGVAVDAPDEISSLLSAAEPST